MENSSTRAMSCGIYPILGPGTPDPGVPGVPPSTLISPLFKNFRPTMHESSVVFPHPEAPSNPYLKKKTKNQIKNVYTITIVDPE